MRKVTVGLLTMFLAGSVIVGAAGGCSFPGKLTAKVTKPVVAKAATPPPVAAPSKPISPAENIYEEYTAQAPKQRWFLHFAQQQGSSSDQILVGQPLFAKGTRFVRVTVTPADTKYVYLGQNEELKVLALRYNTTVTGIIAANGCYLGWPQAYIQIWVPLPPGHKSTVFDVQPPGPSSC